MSEQNPFFGRLVGHERTVDDLRRLVEKHRIPHALLFTGPEGCGKRLAAYGLAAEILKTHAATPSSVFHLLEVGSHPDLHPVERDEEKKDLSVDNIRTVRSALQLQPFLGSAAVAVIDNAHQMNIAAANALLLTLEEPAEGRFLVLVTHAPQRLPETIVSRCQTVRFGELGDDHVAKVVENLFPESLNAKQRDFALSLAGSTLGPLGLSDFVEPRTLKLRPGNDSAKHLLDLYERAENLEAALERSFSGEAQMAGDSLSLASLLSEDKGDDLAWLLLRTVARRALRSASTERAPEAAALLLQALEAERMVRDRNASPQLQLSSLFLRAGAASCRVP